MESTLEPAGFSHAEFQEQAQTEGFLVSGGSGNPFSVGSNLLVMPSEKREFFLENKVFPYEATEEGEIVEIPKDRLDVLVAEKCAYLAEENEFREKLEAVKKELKESGKEWYSLDLVRKIDGIWKVWLNPAHQRLYHAGWYELQDLLDWKNNTGKVMMAN